MYKSWLTTILLGVGICGYLEPLSAAVITSSTEMMSKLSESISLRENTEVVSLISEVSLSKELLGTDEYSGFISTLKQPGETPQKVALVPQNTEIPESNLAVGLCALSFVWAAFAVTIK